MVVLDIEGTTTPIAFVYDVLFPFARTHVQHYIEARLAADDTVPSALGDEWAADVEAGETPPPWHDRDARAIADYVLWLMDRDRKSTGLKALQGEVWRAGYVSGELRGQLFPDVAPALRAWHEQGVRVAIFSSGSEMAQRLLFGHTTDGDMTHLVSAYFDTTVGAKGDAASYRTIARALERPPGAVVFVSDVVSELDAARVAGLRTRLCVRPGNHEQPQHTHRVVRALDQIDLTGMGAP